MKLLHITIIGVFVWFVMPNINLDPPESIKMPSLPKSISVDPVAVFLFALPVLAIFAARAKNKRRHTTKIKLSKFA